MTDDVTDITSLCLVVPTTPKIIKIFLFFYLSFVNFLKALHNSRLVGCNFKDVFSRGKVYTLTIKQIYA